MRVDKNRKGFIAALLGKEEAFYVFTARLGTGLAIAILLLTGHII